MEQTQDERIHLYFRRTAAGSAAIICAIGLSSMAGWFFDLDFPRTYLAGTKTMKFNSAVLFTALGAALYLRSIYGERFRKWGIAAAITALFFALPTMIAYLLRIQSFPLDQLLISEAPGHLLTHHPGRMAPSTAAAFILAAITFLIAGLRQRRAALAREALALTVMMTGFLILIGYIYFGRFLFYTGIYITPMSVPSALAMALLGTGLLLSEPEKGFMSLAAADSEAGRLLRIMLPAATAVPLLTGWLRIKGENLGLYGPEAGITLTVLAMALLLVFFICAAARSIHRQELEKDEKKESLRRSEEELTDLYNNAPCGYHSLDKDGVFVRINDTELAMFDRTREEVIGKLKLSDMLTPASAEYFYKVFKEFQRTGVAKNLEFQLLRSDGKDVHILLNSVPLYGAGGEFLRSKTVILDITEIKKMQAQLKTVNTRLAEANKELEAFSYSVSHDLRAPLRGIEGFSKILLEDYGAKLDAEAQRLINVVRNNTLKMAQLIDDMLAFSRASRASLNRETVDMDELALEAWREAVPPGNPPRCSMAELPPATGDRAMLKQVWANLFSNAVKFTSKTEAPEIEVGCALKDGFLVYTVKDNGAGFDQAYANKLFGIFQRLHTEQEFPGTGVGLALSNRIVVKHGGWMKAEGIPGKGAAFYFALPAAAGNGGSK